MNQHPLRVALTEHQTAIGILLDEADVVLHSADPARAPMMMLLRLRLTQRLRSYREFKHTLLFDPLCGRTGTAVEKFAYEMRDRCDAAGQLYASHVEDWADTRLDDNWLAYKDAAGSVVAAIRQHIAREQQDAEQLLWVKLWKAT